MKKQPTWAQFREQEKAKALKWMFYILYPGALFGVLLIYYLRWVSLRWLIVILMALNLVAVGICLGAIGVHLVRFSDTLKQETSRIGIYLPPINQAVFIIVPGKLTPEQLTDLKATLSAAAKKYQDEVTTLEGFDLYDVINTWCEKHEIIFEADFNYDDERLFVE